MLHKPSNCVYMYTAFLCSMKKCPHFYKEPFLIPMWYVKHSCITLQTMGNKYKILPFRKPYSNVTF